MYTRTIISAMMLFCSTCLTMAEETPVNLTISDATVESGSTVTIPVMMSGQASGYQFEVYPPAGLTLTKIQRGDIIKAKDDEDEYVFTFQNATRDNGGRFVLCYSMSVLTAEAGEVAKLVFSADQDLEPGVYSIEMKNAECAHKGIVLNTYREKSAKLTVTNSTGVDNVETANSLKGNIYVYNTTGQLVKTIIDTAMSDDITSGLKAGTYVVKGNGEAYKVVKE